MPSVNRHLDALLKLSAEERYAAAEALLKSLEDEREDDPGWTEAWPVEIQQRIEENAPGIPADDVFADLRARFRAKE